MVRFLVIAAVLTLQLGLSVPAAAGGKQLLSEFMKGLRTMRANFEQTVLDTKNSHSGKSRGVFWLLRPQRFRWDYLAPDEKSIIADGRNVWIVEHDLEQVTHLSQSQTLRGTPASLLADELDIETQFEVNDIGTSQDLQWVELIPCSGDSQFTNILLAFNGRELQRMEMVDEFGQTTHFRFFDVMRNPKLNSELFKFDRQSDYDMLEL